MEVEPQSLNRSPLVSPTRPPFWYEKRWVQYAGMIFCTVFILYGMVYVDVVLRARESYLEGEKYWYWHEHPQAKKEELQKKFENEKTKLNRKLAKKKLTQDEYDRQLEILQFDRDRKMGESSIKYAYVWYQTAYELFSPPESKWVKLSRAKALLAKEKWKEELRAKKIPFEDYMFE